MKKNAIKMKNFYVRKFAIKNLHVKNIYAVMFAVMIKNMFVIRYAKNCYNADIINASIFVIKETASRVM